MAFHVRIPSISSGRIQVKALPVSILLLATLLPIASRAQSDPTSTSIPNSDDQTPSFNFQYLFVVLAVAAAAVLLFLLMISRRKRRMQMIRAQSQRALVHDVAYQGRVPRPGGWGWPSNDTDEYRPPRRTRRFRTDGTEGLNERGEAPPPYVPGTKPPSIASTDGLERMGSSRSVARRASSDEDLELGNMTRPSYGSPTAPPSTSNVPPPSSVPPPYVDYSNTTPGEQNSSSIGTGAGAGGITRPDPAVTR